MHGICMTAAGGILLCNRRVRFNARHWLAIGGITSFLLGFFGGTDRWCLTGHAVPSPRNSVGFDLSGVPEPGKPHDCATTSLAVSASCWSLCVHHSNLGRICIAFRYFRHEARYPTRARGSVGRSVFGARCEVGRQEAPRLWSEHLREDRCFLAFI